MYVAHMRASYTAAAYMLLLAGCGGPTPVPPQTTPYVSPADIPGSASGSNELPAILPAGTTYTWPDGAAVTVARLSTAVAGPPEQTVVLIDLVVTAADSSMNAAEIVVHARGSAGTSGELFETAQEGHRISGNIPPHGTARGQWAFLLPDPEAGGVTVDVALPPAFERAPTFFAGPVAPRP